jgi:formate hydrogenlyase subunit 4
MGVVAMNPGPALLAQIVHLALVLAAAPIATGLLNSLRARMAGATGPSPLQPLNDLRRLLRKQPVMAESASTISRFAPCAILALTIAAAAIVPSFTRAMLFGPLADLILVLLLLGLARVLLAFACMDAGTAAGALDAQGISRLAVRAGAPLFVAALALATTAGSSNINLISAQVQDGLVRPATGFALAAFALALMTFAGVTTTPRNAAFSGRDLALLQAAEAVRLLVWLNLFGVIALPVFMAGPVSGWAAWPLGLAAWAARTVLLTVCVACGFAFAGPPRRIAPLLATASALGVLASLFVLTGTGRM